MLSILTARGRSKKRRVVIIVSRYDQVQRALTAYGSSHLSDDAVQTILQQPRPGSGQSAPEPVIQRLETESGAVLFTRGDRR